MIITRIETLRLTERPNLIWVLVHTDEGLTGLGETYFGAVAVEADIHERIAPLILGEDAGSIERLHAAMRPYVGFCGTGAEMRALSAVDVALWDLAGQAAGKPVYTLLGGPVRKSIKVYNTCAGPDYVSQTADVRPGNFGLDTVEPKQGTIYQDLYAFMNHPADLAAELLEMGISSMKIWPFDFAEGVGDGMDISAGDLARALQPFEAIREAHGDRMDIKAELHGLWSLPAAKKIAAALDEIEPDWIEDPIWMDRIDLLPDLGGGTLSPIAGGETLGGIGQLSALIQSGGVSVPIMDVTWGGGVTVAKKAAVLAQAHGLPIAFHDCSGPVTLSASTHLALACPNVAEQEMTRGFYYGWYHELVDQPAPIDNGMISAPDLPGLGLKLHDNLKSRPDAVLRVSQPG